MQSKTKKKFVVASRDFAMNMIFNREKDGTVIICASTDNFKGDCPPMANTVRAESPLSGFILGADPSNPNRTLVTCINELDFKGSIPEFALRQAFKDQGMQIAKLRSVLPRWKKMFPGEKY